MKNPHALLKLFSLTLLFVSANAMALEPLTGVFALHPEPEFTLVVRIDESGKVTRISPVFLDESDDLGVLKKSGNSYFIKLKKSSVKLASNDDEPTQSFTFRNFSSGNMPVVAKPDELPLHIFSKDKKGKITQVLGALSLNKPIALYRLPKTEVLFLERSAKRMLAKRWIPKSTLEKDPNSGRLLRVGGPGVAGMGSSQKGRLPESLPPCTELQFDDDLKGVTLNGVLRASCAFDPIRKVLLIDEPANAAGTPALFLLGHWYTVDLERTSKTDLWLKSRRGVNRGSVGNKTVTSEVQNEWHFESPASTNSAAAE
jgi:hypothetical protein